MTLENTTVATGSETAVASTGASAPSSTSTPSASPQSSRETSATTGAPEPQAPVAVAPPAYSPNFKYKVLKEEKEFPDWAKQLVKDEALEKAFRETFEKADGLPIVKDHRDRLEQESKYVQEHVMPWVSQVNEAFAYRDNGDLHSFFKAMNLNENQIFQYALQRLQLRENPQQLQVHDEAIQLRNENARLAREIESLRTGSLTQSSQARTTELDSYLTRPEMVQAVTELDARLGKPGAFRAEVIRRGKSYSAMGQDISVEDAIRETLALTGWKAQAAAPTAEPSVTLEPAHADAPAPKPATLPNIKGKGTSPVKKQFTSLAELRKHAASMRGG